MTNKQVKTCDLCGSNIKIFHDDLILNSGWNQALFDYESTYQYWPRHKDDKAPMDVCRSCCVILDKAQREGIIKYNDVSYEYYHEVREPVVITEEELIASIS